MSKSLRWLPAFPCLGYKWPWPDGYPLLPGWSATRLNTIFEPTSRQRLFSPRPWIGRVCCLSGFNGTAPVWALNSLGIIQSVSDFQRLLVLREGSFRPFFDFTMVESVQGNFSWRPFSFYQAEADPPVPFTETPLLYERASLTIGFPWARLPPKKGRWSPWCYEGVLGARQILPIDENRFEANYQFHFVNGCDASYDDEWRHYGSLTGWYPPAEITPEQESALLVALEALEFEFEPDKLFFDYDTV
jgi:hypothetical protein